MRKLSIIIALLFFSGCTQVTTVKSTPTVGDNKRVDNNLGDDSEKNIIKMIPPNTTPGRYGDRFPAISTLTKLDPLLNQQFPVFPVTWFVDSWSFDRNNKMSMDYGVSFITSPACGYYGNYYSCNEYVYNHSPNCNTNPNNFNSSIPFQFRWTYGGSWVVPNNPKPFGNAEQAYNYGYNSTGSAGYGSRTKINGKDPVAYITSDQEFISNSDELLGWYLGASAKCAGYVSDMYSGIFAEGFNRIDPSKYPDARGNYTSYSQNLDGTPYSGGRNHGSSINQAFDPNYRISIPSKGINNKSILDIPQAVPSMQTGLFADACYKQGTTLTNIGYPGSTTELASKTINKFGRNPNTEHYIAKVILGCDANKWYCVNKLNNRPFNHMVKLVADDEAGGVGRVHNSGNSVGKKWVDDGYTYSDVKNPRYAYKHVNRADGYSVVAFNFFTGCWWMPWDINQGYNGRVVVGNSGYPPNDMACYDGALGFINRINQKENFGTEQKSLVEVVQNAKYKLHESEISYDGGVTWKKEKAQDYVLNMTSIPQRQFITTDGYWGVYLCRPENTEALNCKLRISFNGQYYYQDISANMWETIDYDPDNTPLDNLPNIKKQFCIVFKKL
jgi:hypothetical protein